MNGNAAPTVLHDTSSVSNYLEHEERSTAAKFFRAPHQPAISFQTEAELLMWAMKPETPEGLRDAIRGFLASAMVLQSNSAVNRLFAEIMVARMLAYPKKTWRDLDVGDAWIGATAVARGLPLITYDRRGFNDVPGLDCRILIY